jgi:hypothetical protein
MTTERMEHESTDKILMDRDLAEINAYYSEHFPRIRKMVRQDVETELFLKCQRPQVDAAGFCDAQAALPYLTCMRQTIERMLAEDAARFSKTRWLWMLRRVPDPVFEGNIPTTRPYQASLADAVSGAFGSDNPERPFEDSEHSIRFKLDGSALPRLLRFAELVTWLSQSHVLWRFSGKGVRFLFAQRSALPAPVPTKDQDECIRLYDERFDKSLTLFGTVGTAISSETDMSDNGFLVSFFSNAEWVQIPVHVQGENMEVKVLKRFLPEMISLDGLAKLNEDARLDGLAWWRPSATAVLALSRGMFRILASSGNSFVSLLRYGYVFINEEYFLEVFSNGWNVIFEDVLRVVPGAIIPDSPAALFDALVALQPTLWPLSPGPVVRRAGSAVWIDVIACTAILERSLEFPIVDGGVGNARADHFEGTTQQTINATSWAPGPELAQMISREIKKADGTKLTDLDALGEKGQRLILVSCKSMVYSGSYDSGNYVTVRNIRTIAEEAVRYWAEVAAYVKKHPKGPNYDFSKYEDIIPVVCTPQVVYVADPYSLRFVEPGLNAVCSLNELRTWLMNN